MVFSTIITSLWNRAVASARYFFFQCLFRWIMDGLSHRHERTTDIFMRGDRILFTIAICIYRYLQVDLFRWGNISPPPHEPTHPHNCVPFNCLSELIDAITRNCYKPREQQNCDDCASILDNGAWRIERKRLVYLWIIVCHQFVHLNHLYLYWGIISGTYWGRFSRHRAIQSAIIFRQTRDSRVRARARVESENRSRTVRILGRDSDLSGVYDEDLSHKTWALSLKS